MGKPLKEVYGKAFAEMAKLSKAAAKIDESKVFEEANLDTRKFMYKILDDNVLPGSGFGNIEHFKELYEKVTKEGKSGLILMEHYTNLDLPMILYLLEKQGEPWAKDLAERIVAIAGMKLNEAGTVERALTEAFTRVVIYPTRSLDSMKAKGMSDEEIAAEEQRARKINFAAMRAMDSCKKRGQIIVVFPSGTRYRPGKPETKRGLREMDSYLRLFDYMILVSVNGNCLRINMETPDDMLSDYVEKDTITLTASPVMNCKEFRNQVLASLPEDETDPKQKTVDAVMEIMEKTHNEVENNRS